MAFNAKNLTYDRNEPAFLRKLRGQYGDGDSRRPTQERPRKAKENDDEDAPVYVDEETNEALSKEEYESLLKGTEAQDETAGHSAEEDKESTDAAKPAEPVTSNEEAKNQQNLAEIGTQKKRRKAKVIRDDEVAQDEDESRRKDNSAAPRPNAKRKKIKLSFDEPE